MDSCAQAARRHVRRRSRSVRARPRPTSVIRRPAPHTAEWPNEPVVVRYATRQDEPRTRISFPSRFSLDVACLNGHGRPPLLDDTRPRRTSASSPPPTPSHAVCASFRQSILTAAVLSSGKSSKEAPWPTEIEVFDFHRIFSWRPSPSGFCSKSPSEPHSCSSTHLCSSRRDR